MKCKVCGKEFQETQYSSEYKDICSSECFNKFYWIEKVSSYQNNPDKFVAIDGSLYYIDDEDSISSFRGFDGIKFVIKMKDSGKVIVTTNLWFNGEIPKELRNQIPDNAEFIKE